MADYSWRVSAAYSPNVTFDLASAVDQTHTDSTHSPIDQFISKNIELNAMLLDPNNFKGVMQRVNQNKRNLSDAAYTRLTTALVNPSTISPVLANLVLLGHISAVESYFRVLFTGLIMIDKPTQEKCHDKLLSYGAVLIHDRSSLPDALLESISLSGKWNIQETLKEFFGVKGALPNSLNLVLTEFGTICQLRHCIIHKFGVIGTRNIRSDISAYRSLINKPVKNNFNTIQNVSLICKNVVNETNQFLWQIVMMRLIADLNQNRWKRKQVSPWTWNWRIDKPVFQKYYNLFYSSLFPPGTTGTTLKAAYDDYSQTYQSLPV